MSELSIGLKNWQESSGFQYLLPPFGNRLVDGDGRIFGSQECEKDIKVAMDQC